MKSPNASSIRRASLIAVILIASLSAFLGDMLAEESATGAKPAAHKYSNRLTKESSLYLKMHAHNPVNWYPWGPEAFEKAKKEKKLIFLSVGYSSCYWCHVMERESFMDEEIAKYLNDHFVCIKVDREERPDVDAIYMTAVQIRSGRGGWPMSVFMTPEGKPFFGGTYFPARDGDRPGSRGFASISKIVNDIWVKTPAAVQKDAETITGLVAKQMNAAKAKVDPTAAMIASVRQTLASTFDRQYGGFGFDPRNPRRPKFPEPSNLMLLGNLEQRNQDKQAGEMLYVTLERMHMGGIWDHIGGGFHRYSVDRFWKIPHFEKMLYDNGQLLTVYTDAYVATKRDDFRRVVERIVVSMNRDLRHSSGAYLAAMDAESEKIEGKFYRWELAEIKKTLGPDYDFFAKIYSLNGQPNFEHEFYVPQLSVPFSGLAKSQNMTVNQLDAKLRPMQSKLLAVRSNRIKPFVDNKVLTSWNGLAIRGLADAGRGLKNPKFIEYATTAADFVLNKLRDSNGRLLRTYTDDGGAQLNAYVDDYAFLVDGLISLHKATGDAKWLATADELTKLQIELFWDESNGGFFFTSKDHESLIARSKSFTDNVQPSGNAVSVENLLYLAKKTNNSDYLKRANTTMQVAGSLVQELPAIATRMAISFGEFKK